MLVHKRLHDRQRIGQLKRLLVAIQAIVHDVADTSAEAANARPIRVARQGSSHGLNLWRTALYLYGRRLLLLLLQLRQLLLLMLLMLLYIVNVGSPTAWWPDPPKVPPIRWRWGRPGGGRRSCRSRRGRSCLVRRNQLGELRKALLDGVVPRLP